MEIVGTFVGIALTLISSVSFMGGLNLFKATPEIAKTRGEFSGRCYVLLASISFSAFMMWLGYRGVMVGIDWIAKYGSAAI